MESLKPGHYWKTPFIWEAGCPEPRPGALRFAEASPEWLATAIGRVMASSSDPSDRFAVDRHGAAGATDELLGLAPEYFTWLPAWWQVARTDEGAEVGFVLPVLFKDERRNRNGQPQGTVFYMGVLPEHRGRGYGGELLAQATRIFIGARCWRIFCDTGTDNAPMVRAFRKAGYIERTPWQRPLA